ncbi:tape measure protein [Cytobacillus sp. FSL W7-1323]|uniref:tape measure protein n=1 Tax=Cytobacillus sp. FSL W7-1323 TaxID=2921700 RepID=UPI003157FD68
MANSDGSVVIDIVLDDSDVNRQVRALNRELTSVGERMPNVFQRALTQVRRGLTSLGTTIRTSFSRMFSGLSRGPFAPITRSISGMTRSFTSSFSRIGALGRSTFSSLARSIRSVDTAAQGPISSMLRMAATITGIAGAMDLMGRAISRVDTIDTATKSLTVLTGSAKDAEMVMNDLIDAIDGTPLALNDVALGAKKMVAAGMDAKKVKPVFKSIADAAYGVGNGAASMDQITDAISSMQSAGTVYADDIGRLVDAGVPAWKILANQTGKSVTEMKKYVSDGMLESDAAIEMFVNGIQNGTKGVAGSTAAMANLAKTAGDTISGSFGNMRIAIVKVLANVVDVLKGDIIGALTGLWNMFKAVGRFTGSEAFAKGLRLIVDVIKALTPALLGLATAFAVFGSYMGVIKMIALMVAAFTALGTAITANPIVAIIAAVIGLSVALVSLYKTNETFRNVVQQSWQAIQNVVLTVADKIKVGINSILPALKSFADWSGDKLIQGWQWLQTNGVAAMVAIGTAIGIAASYMSNFVGYLMESSFIQAIIEGIKLSFENLHNILLTLVPFIAKIGLAFLGVTGPLGWAIALITTFSATLLKMGGFSAEGIYGALDKFGQALKGILDQALVLVPQFIEIGAQLIVKLIQGIASSIPKVVSVVQQILQMFTQTVATYLPVIASVAVMIITTLVEGIATYLPQLINTYITIITILIELIGQYLPAIIEAGIQILTTLITGIVNALPMIVNTVILIVTTLIGLIIENLPMVIETGVGVLMALIDGIVQALPVLITAALTLVITLLSAILDQLPTILMAGVELLLALIDGILSILPSLIETAITLIVTVVMTLIGALPQIIAAGIKILEALIKGIIQLIPALIKCALQLIVALVGALIKNLPQIIRAGIQILNALVRGILSIIGTLLKAGAELIVKLAQAIAKKFPSIVKEGKKIPGEIVDGIKETISKMTKIGEDLISGIVKGIGNGFGWVKDKIVELGGNITSWASSILKIKSPSRVMRDKIGKWIPAGIAVGIDEDADQVKKAMSKMLNSSQITAEAAIGVKGSSFGKQLNLSQKVMSGSTKNEINGGSETVLPEKLEAVINIAGYQARGLVDFLKGEQKVNSRRVSRNIKGAIT